MAAKALLVLSHSDLQTDACIEEDIGSDKALFYIHVLVDDVRGGYCRHVPDISTMGCLR